MLNNSKTQWSKIQAIAIARAFSLLGTELTIFTLVFRDKELGPVAISALFIIGTLPMILFAPWSGLIADRYSTKLVIPIASFIGATAIFAQTLPLELWATFALLFIANTCAAVVSPTWAKLIPLLATKEDIGRSMGISQTYFSTAGLAGPVFAGFLVSQTGYFWTFAIDAFATALVGLMPFFLNVNHRPAGSEPGEKTDLVAGIRFIAGNAVLRALILMFFFLTLAVGVVNVGDVFLITDILKGDAQIYGLVGSGFAIGTLLFSSFAASKSIEASSELKLLGVGSLVLTLCVITVGSAPNYWVVMAIWALAGASNAPLNTYGVAILVRTVPHEIQGRVFAAVGAIVSIGSIGSMAVGGILIGAFGVREVLIASGVLALAVVMTFYPQVYREQRKVLSAEQA